MSNFYDKLLNIRGLDVEEEIKKVVFETREHFKNLTEERTCRIYSGMVYDKLREKGISARLIDTADFGEDYSHVFVMVPFENKYFLVDLTYSQFLDNENGINSLVNDGYVLMDNDMWKNYMENILVKKNFTYDDIFNGVRR